MDGRYLNNQPFYGSVGTSTLTSHVKLTSWCLISKFVIERPRIIQGEPNPYCLLVSQPSNCIFITPPTNPNVKQVMSVTSVTLEQSSTQLSSRGAARLTFCVCGSVEKNVRKSTKEDPHLSPKGGQSEIGDWKLRWRGTLGRNAESCDSIGKHIVEHRDSSLDEKGCFRHF